MNPVNIYARVIITIITAIGLWGFLAPMLFSANLPIIFSVIVVVIVPVIAYYLLKPIFNKK